MSLLQVSDLRKSYDGRLAVRGISFQVNAGEVVGLLGPNGAGKSTTMMMLAGLLRPDAGTIHIDGEPFVPTNARFRRLLGVVPQDLAVYPELTPRENLTFFGRLYGLRGHELEARIAEVLEQIGLTRQADDKAGTFSGGMKRRLNFGVALLHQPKLLILDEPTVGVDPQSRSHLLDAVRHISERGVSVLYASHYMEEVEAVCERVIIIDRGQIVAAGAVRELLSRTAGDVRMSVDRIGTLSERLGALAAIETGSNGGGTIVLSMAETAAQPLCQRLTRVLSVLAEEQIEVKAIETREANLERLFLELTGRTLRD